MIPTEKELIAFIAKHEIVNFSMIAKHFEIQNTTVTDLIDALVKKKLAKVKKFGGSKIAVLIKRGSK